VVVILTQKSQGHYGYKLVSEDMGPYEFACPLKLLDLTNGFNCESSKRWRNDVRTFHATKQAKKAIEYNVGDWVECYGKVYQIVEKTTKTRFIVKNTDGVRYKTTRARIGKKLPNPPMTEENRV
jgi:hypothetical protein